MIYGICFLFLSLVMISISVAGSGDRRCLKGRYQKRVPPGPENDIPADNVCSAWRSNSCCNVTTATLIHNITADGKWLNFDYDHCQKLSEKCRRHFIQDVCFYECSPNLGPWLKEDKRAIREERFVDVPLCHSECDKWYDDCKDDMTCAADWSAEFDWISVDGAPKKQQCKADSKCEKFSVKFGNASTMCEKIFGGSFKYVYENQPCFRLNFNFSEGNPNDKVFEWKTAHLNNAHSSFSLFGLLAIMLLVGPVFLLQFL